MYLIEYTEIETTIFLSVKKYFEGLPPTGTDDYTNAFFDLVAQYTGDGESYILVGDYFDDLVESTILDQINKLSFIEKTALKCFYEKHFLSNYLDEQGNDYVYTNEKLAVEVTSSFKSWIDDNFNLADMMDETDENDEDEEQDEDEQNENSLEQAIEKEDTIFVDDLFADTKEEEQLFDKYESEDQIKLITRIINSLLEKNLSNYQRRQLQVAQVYLSYHPIVPAEDYLITISFKNDFTFFEIT